MRQNIRVFVSSPSDVSKERKKIFNVVNSLNRYVGDIYDVTIECLSWQTHVAPDMGRRQEIINKNIGDYDIFVGIMWKRYGTSTGKADSGTVEEFNIAYKNWKKFNRPRILFYFSQAN